MGDIVANDLPVEDMEVINEEILDEDEEKEHSYLDYSSLFIFPPRFRLRVWVDKIITHNLFKNFIIITIILNTILLACWDPEDPDAEESRNQIINDIDFGFLIIYTIELILKVFVMGFIVHKKSYLRNPWNQLDGFVVVAGWVSVVLFSFKGVSGLRSLRVLRVLKPLRLISGLPQLRKIFDTILVALPFLASVALLMIVVFTLYGIFGVVLFNGELRHHCVENGDFNPNSCCDKDPGYFGGYECPVGKCKLTDDNPDFGFYNYDNVFYAWLALFLLINLEGWTRWAYMTMDATNAFAIFYYIAVIIVGAIFWINLLLAVVSVTMTNLPLEKPVVPGRKVRFLLRLWFKFRKFMIRTLPPNIIYRVCKRIVKHKVFQGITMVVIIINIIVLAMVFRHQPYSYTLTLDIIDLCCLIFFTFEMILRLIGIGIWKYFSKAQNYIDFIVVITGWIEVILTLTIGDESGLAVIRVLRALRLLRMLKLARKWEALKHVIHAIIAVIPSMFFFMLLFSIVTFTFMLIGIRLFGGQLDFDGVTFRYNFDSLYWSFITLFIVTTGEQWPNILFACMRVHKWEAAIYFIIWKALSTYLLLNLFLSLLIDSFETERNQQKENAVAKKKRKRNPNEDIEIEMEEFKTEETENNIIESSGSSEEEVPEIQTTDKEDKSKEYVIHKNQEKTLVDRFLMPPVGQRRYFADKVCFCIPAKKFPRKQIASVIRSNVYEWIMIFIIILSCITLTIFDPGYSIYSTRGWIMFSLTLLFTIIYTIEAILKMITYGIIRTRGSYFRNGWDIIDFLILIISWIAVGISFVPTRSAAAYVSFRALWALKLLSKFRGTQKVVRVVLQTLHVVPQILAIAMFLWVIFTIAGLQLFVGQYYYCSTDSGNFVSFVDDLDECENLGFNWDHWPSYFSHFGTAFLTIVRAANVNFPDPLIHGVDVAGEDNNPIRDNHPEYAIFWVIFIIICSWFILGLFIGVIVDMFNTIRNKRKWGDSIFLTEKQREWVQLQRVLFSLRPSKPVLPGGSGRLKTMIFGIVNSKPFEITILLLIVYGAIIQCTLHYEQAWTWELLQDVTDIVITAVFTVEAALKIFGLGIRGYFHWHWNKFDFFILVVSWIDVIGIIIGADSDVLSIIRTLRTLRLLRFARIIRFSRRLQILLKAALLSVATLLNILLVMIVVFYIYVVIGCYFFYDLDVSESIDAPLNRIANWQTIPRGALMCLRILTGESWDLVQAEMMEEQPVYAIIYCISFVVIMDLLLLNLVVSVLYENLGLLVTFDLGDDLTRFTDVWRLYDPYGTKFIPEDKLPDFLMNIRPPLGFGNMSRSGIDRIIEELDIPVTVNGSVYFPDVLLALCERLYEVDASELLLHSIMEGWKNAFPPAKVVKGRRRLPIWDDEEEKPKKPLISVRNL